MWSDDEKSGPNATCPNKSISHFRFRFSFSYTRMFYSSHFRSKLLSESIHGQQRFTRATQGTPLLIGTRTPCKTTSSRQTKYYWKDLSWYHQKLANNWCKRVNYPNVTSTRGWRQNSASTAWSVNEDWKPMPPDTANCATIDQEECQLDLASQLQ
jgi:hypothetical protein